MHRARLFASQAARRGVPVPWEDWRASVEALLGLGRVSEVLTTAERALNEGHAPGELLELLLRLPAHAQEESAFVRLYLRLLTNTGQPDEVLALVRGEVAGGQDAPHLHAYLAWALNRREDYGAALGAADEALRSPDRLLTRERALAWRARGLALNRLDPAGDWQTPFAQALELAEGWSRGLVLIDLGSLHSGQGHEEEAMLAFSQALPLLTGQAFYRAWTLNNMGMICLRTGQLQEAETYFGEVARLRTEFRSRALAGQATVRRALGEWARAEALYVQAADAAQASGDQDDLRHARRGLGYTQRLRGQSMRALDTLQQAAQTTDADRAGGRSWVHVDLAAARLGRDLLDPAAVRAHLERADTPDREDAERAVIVRAELARREGRAAEAVSALAALNPRSLWMREEAHAFAALFGLLPPGRRPEPLPRPAQLHVHLRVLGVPEVTVNGRRVRLSALEVTLLAALVLDGDLTTESLIGVLDDRAARSRRLAAQRVSRVVGTLRTALGWPESVRHDAGTYLLDRSTCWTCDLVPEAPPVETFMRGVDLPWVTEREQELLQRD
ncbi:tetratricopeptide repeat protein [Deinococcus petrolearius]|uniref:Tetratricopeptide repeat protein n=1 Tax=Deinococcus petrolearius TaxID=1751295 RepID=A0ABW1DIT0_9DEIO